MSTFRRDKKLKSKLNPLPISHAQPALCNNYLSQYNYWALFAILDQSKTLIWLTKSIFECCPE